LVTLRNTVSRPCDAAATSQARAKLSPRYWRPAGSRARSAICSAPTVGTGATSGSRAISPAGWSGCVVAAGRRDADRRVRSSIFAPLGRS
jgi:hypothetical protein